MKKGTVKIDQTVIHATLRTEDLVAAFTDEYERLGGLESNVTLFRSHLQMENPDGDKDRTLLYDLEDLFDLLGGMAPEGTTFGSHEGDGSDFGFWTDEDERYGHAQLTGQELYDHDHPPPLENPMDWEQ